MKTNRTPHHSIKSTHTAFDIIESIQQNDGATLSELSKEVGVTKSTIHSHLSTLMERGYIWKEDREYHIGLLFLNLGTSARDKKVPSDLIKSGVHRVASQVDERSQFAVEEYGRGYTLYRERGSQAIRTGRPIGQPMYLHDTAAGKAILSQMSDERVEETISHWGLPKTTANTITDPDSLRRELDEIRETSVAINRGESRVGLRALASPITTGDDVIGAISVSAPKQRMRGEKEQETKDILLGIVNEIVLNIG